MPANYPLAFIANPLDRVHPRRDNSAWVAAERARADARFVIIAGDRPLYGAAGNPAPSVMFAPADADRLVPDGPELFLGLDEAGHPVFARLGPALGEGTAPDGIGHGDLRALALGGEVPSSEVAIVAMARSMLAWHESHRFCSKCGQPSQMVLAGFRRDCPSCGAQHFPRTDPVVIMLITDGDRALIARSARFPPNRYSALAGFVEPGETIEEAVRREIFEESGIRVGRVTYHMSQPWPYPSSLMIACYGEAATTEIEIDPKEIEHAMWVTRAELADALAGKGAFSVPDGIAIAHHLIADYTDTGV